jgi:succinyl-CoA synthetase alpha subunit
MDLLPLFEADPDTDAVVLVGEIGGDEEERTAAFIKENISKPVFSFIVGHTAPEGKRMGHAGAIVSGGSGTAESKTKALGAAGVPVAKTIDELADLVQGAFAG